MSENQEEELERHYKFLEKTGTNSRDVKEVLVPESELKHEHTVILAAQIWHSFTMMPGIVQDMFLARVDQEIKKHREMAEAALKQKSTILDPNGDIAAYSLIKGEA